MENTNPTNNEHDTDDVTRADNAECRISQSQQNGMAVDDSIEEPIEYAGFWLRVLASIIDSVIVSFITLPILLAYYGTSYINLNIENVNPNSEFSIVKGPVDFLVSYVLPAIGIVTLWVCRQSTPGKMLLSAKIVDAKTLGKLTVSQSIIRYFGYFVSTFPLGLGLIWVAFDEKKRGWHDMIAGTLVIIDKSAPHGKRDIR